MGENLRKRSLTVLINEDLYDKLLQLAISKYKKTHGALSRTVEDILRWYFSLGDQNAR